MHFFNKKSCNYILLYFLQKNISFTSLTMKNFFIEKKEREERKKALRGNCTDTEQILTVN